MESTPQVSDFTEADALLEWVYIIWPIKSR